MLSDSQGQYADMSRCLNQLGILFVYRSLGLQVLLHTAAWTNHPRCFSVNGHFVLPVCFLFRMDAPAGGLVITLQQPACCNNCFQKVFWISDTLSQGYTKMQSSVKCLDHRCCIRYSMQSSKVVLGCAMH